MAASASGLVLLLLSASVVHGDNGWSVTYTTTEICAVEGATVEMSCSYEYPYSFRETTISIKKEFWFTRMNDNEYVELKSDPLYEHRVEYWCSWSHSCTLTITNVTKSDSGVYRFRFTSNHPDGKFTGDPGVTLSITDDPNLHVNKYSTWRLNCNSKCLLPDHRSYIWYENGHELPQRTSSSLHNTYRTHSYSCALRGHEAFPASSVYAPDVPSVSVLPSANILENSSVTLTCSSDANPAANYTWYQRDSHPESIHEGPQLVFSSIQSSDSGHFYCVAENQLGRRRSEFVSINVEYAPDVPSVSVVPSGKSVMIMNITRLTLVVLMLIPVFVLSLWTRKKTALISESGRNKPAETLKSESLPDYENITAAQTDDTEEPDDLV